MVNIFLFENALKITWIRRTINQSDIDWNKILHESNHKVNKLARLGGDFPVRSRNFKNQFWLNVFEYWTDFCFKNKPLNKFRNFTIMFMVQ